VGKPTGFLEYARQGNHCQPPLERVAYWNEFHPRLGREERQRQGARCMACGVPFCQSGAVLNGMVSGCPLHNLVPEWNDLVYRRKLGRALERLLKTNDFPEFTGRVCPALCEAACTCGLNGQPVTVKDNELGIIEEAWEQGLMSPRPPETRTGRTVAVVGSGPAGLSCAQRLNRRGHSVTVFERADRPGGLLMYGIPNMKLEKSVVQRRLDLMAAEGIAFRTGVDAGRDVGQEELREQFDAVVLCCGAAQPRDLDVPGRAGVDVWFAVDFLTGATRALLDGTYCPSYLRMTGIPYTPIYGDIGEVKKRNGALTLKTTGVSRSGCMYCMYGVHLEHEPNRFQLMEKTHPQQYHYCIHELGLGAVLDYIGVPYSCR